MYCYSFEPYPWTQHFAGQQEILKYIHHCAGMASEANCGGALRLWHMSGTPVISLYLEITWVLGLLATRTAGSTSTGRLESPLRRSPKQFHQ